MRRQDQFFLSCVLALSLIHISSFAQLRPRKAIAYCLNQAQRTLKEIPEQAPNLPRSIPKDSNQWNYVNFNDWCSGFWPGILWYLYEDTGNQFLASAAFKYTAELEPLSKQSGFDHDLGFMIFCSYGNGYRLTCNPFYKKVILRAADSLASLYNPRIGTILSWPSQVQKMHWPHNTIIDNMMNLELLFWASKHGGRAQLYEIAIRHAETTMKNHFRSDYSAYHVVVYDTVSGQKLKGITHQGYADNSMWARGQSWAIYGFTMCYRESNRDEFLNFAEKVADVYLRRLPKDLIPYWDFDDPTIPNTSRDVSAACITASALLELSTFVRDPVKAKFYRSKAEAMLKTLSGPVYQSRKLNSAFLLHSTGHRPAGTEVDASIIYADYYYLEALMRLKKLQNGRDEADHKLRKS